MKMKSFLMIFAFIPIVATNFVNAQSGEIMGIVVADGDVENIHVINRNSLTFTTTNTQGAFRISAKINDSLEFTSIRYKKKTIIVSAQSLQEKQLTVYLEEQVNELDEVIVGKVLTGKLDSDVRNSDTERPIDFYDLGIPGYTGVPLTQSERRLQEATTAQPGVIPILPILNAITGRTRMLKERVRLERNSELLQAIKENLADSFFENNPLKEAYQEEFFFFCSEDPEFEDRCRDKSDLEIYDYMVEKYKAYLINLNNAQD